MGFYGNGTRLRIETAAKTNWPHKFTSKS